jgi:hypothetical protein
MVEPRTNVGEPFRVQPPEIPDGALQANGGWMRLSHRGKTPVFALDAEYTEVLLAFFGHRHVDMFPVSPEPEQSPIPGGKQTRHLSPGFTAHDRARPGVMFRDGPTCPDDIA